jgi:uncharacterized protein YcfJ
MKQAMRMVGLWLILALFSIVSLQPTPAMAAPDDRSAKAQLIVEQKKKPWYKTRTAKIVGGSAGAGAVVGALVGGGKGAAAGALVGGGAGYVYERKTRKR